MPDFDHKICLYQVKQIFSGNFEFPFRLFSYIFSGYCGILWGPTQGLTTDTFEVSSTATAQTVN